MYIQITPATNLAVSVDQLKANIGIYHTEKDSILELYIQAASDYAEKFTGCQLMPAVYELQLSYYSEFIKLSKFPFTSIVSVKYYNADNELITMVEDTDYLVISGNKGMIQFLTDFVLYDRPDALQIQFNCGFGDADAVPSLLKNAIILMASKMYDNPVDSVENLPKASTNLLRQYRQWTR